MNTLARIALALLTMRVTQVVAQTPAAGAKPASRPKVVFVCEHGSAKSVMAAAEFERLAKKSGLTVDVIGRGSNPDAEVNGPIRQHLLADGMDIGSSKPIKVSAKDLAGAARSSALDPISRRCFPRGSLSSIGARPLLRGRTTRPQGRTS